MNLPDDHSLRTLVLFEVASGLVDGGVAGRGHGLLLAKAPDVVGGAGAVALIDLQVVDMTGGAGRARAVSSSGHNFLFSLDCVQDCHVITAKSLGTAYHFGDTECLLVVFMIRA